MSLSSVVRQVSIFTIEVDGKRVPRVYLDRISEFSIQEKEDHTTEYSWTVVDAAMGEDDVVHHGSKVRIKYGWLGRLSRAHECVVTEIEPTFDVSGVKHTVRLKDAGLALDNKQTHAAPKGPLGMIVADVCKRGGLTLYVKNAQGVLGAVRSVADLPEELKAQSSEVQAGITDRQFIKRLARRLDYRVRVDGKDLYFEKPDYAASPKRDYIWRGGVGDLISFRPATKTHGKDHGAAAETKTVGVSTATKRVITGIANAETEKGEPVMGKEDLSSIGVLSVTGREVKLPPGVTGKVIASPSSNEKQLRDHAKDSRARAGSKAVDATMEILGDPELERGQAIRVFQVGRKHSGPYHVLTVKQTITKDGGFKTSVGLVRHGGQSVKKGVEKKTQGKPNESKPETRVGVRISDGKEKLL